MRALLLVLLLAVAYSQVVTTNFGCKNLSADGVTCNQCSNRFFKDTDGICQPVSTSCKTYDPATGDCKSCYDGFLLIEVICIKDPKPKDPNCANFKEGVCKKCSKGFYLLDTKCELIDPLCKSFDSNLLECTDCYSGYQLDSAKKCQVAPPAATMPGCSQIKDNVCVKCARDYWQDSNGACVLSDPICKTFDRANGDCLTCFSGYKLQGTTCAIQVGSNDPNCKTWKQEVCQQCSKGFYFDQNNICIQIDPFCKSFDLEKLECTECYSGFQLVNNNACELNLDQPTLDVNCNSFDGNGKCLNCSKGFYFDVNQVCIQVSPSCKSFDYQQKLCTQCFPGYNLIDNVCVRQNSKVTALSNCAEELQGVCVQCVERAYYDIDNKCVMASDLCKTFNTFSGFCTSCYLGYALDQTTGQCIPSSTANCRKTDPNTNLCTQCTQGNYLDASSVCQPIDQNCQNFNHPARACDKCYKGYKLDANKNCIVAPVITSPTVKNCVSYDSTGQICVKCYKRFYLKQNRCIESDPLCKTFDVNGGACLTCYNGFTLQSPNCVFG